MMPTVGAWWSRVAFALPLRCGADEFIMAMRLQRAGASQTGAKIGARAGRVNQVARRLEQEFPKGLPGQPPFWLQRQPLLEQVWRGAFGAFMR